MLVVIKNSILFNPLKKRLETAKIAKNAKKLTCIIIIHNPFYTILEILDVEIYQVTKV